MHLLDLFTAAEGCHMLTPSQYAQMGTQALVNHLTCVLEP